MRSFILILLVLPVVSFSQINRSAKELAGEQIQEYINNKLFKDQGYKPVSTGDLKSFHDKRDLDIEWTIVQTFEITKNKKITGDKSVTPKEYKFQFYLDERMKVIKADSYFIY